MHRRDNGRFHDRGGPPLLKFGTRVPGYPGKNSKCASLTYPGNGTRTCNDPKKGAKRDISGTFMEWEAPLVQVWNWVK